MSSVAIITTAILLVALAGIDGLDSFFGDGGLRTTTQALLGGVEALLFGICLVGGLVLVRWVRVRRVVVVR